MTVSFVVASVFFPILQSTGMYLSYLGGKKLFGIQTTYNVLTQIISSLFLIIALFLTNNLIILVLIYFLSYATLGAIFFVLSVKKNPLNSNVDEKFIGFGKHLTLLHVISTIASQIDKILLFNLLGPAQLAIYTFALMPASEANIFLKNIRVTNSAEILHKNQKEIEKTLLTKYFESYTCNGIIGRYLYFNCPVVYKILFPQYLDSINYAQLLLLIILFFPFSLISLFISKRK